MLTFVGCVYLGMILFFASLLQLLVCPWSECSPAHGCFAEPLLWCCDEAELLTALPQQQLDFSMHTATQHL